MNCGFAVVVKGFYAVFSVFCLLLFFFPRGSSKASHCLNYLMPGTSNAVSSRFHGLTLRNDEQGKKFSCPFRPQNK